MWQGKSNKKSRGTIEGEITSATTAPTTSLVIISLRMIFVIVNDNNSFYFLLINDIIRELFNLIYLYVKV